MCLVTEVLATYTTEVSAVNKARWIIDGFLHVGDGGFLANRAFKHFINGGCLVLDLQMNNDKFAINNEMIQFNSFMQNLSKGPRLMQTDRDTY